MKKALIEALAVTAVVSFAFFMVLVLITTTSIARGYAVPADIFAALYRWLSVFAGSLTGAVVLGRLSLAT